MKKSILEIYALAVCFMGVVAIVISLSTGIYDLIEISSPDFTIDQWQYEQHSSNDKFWENYPNRYPSKLNGSEVTKPSEEKLTQMRNDSYNVVLKNEQRSGTQSLVQTVIIFILSSIVFFFHWKIFNKTQKE